MTLSQNPPNLLNTSRLGAKRASVAAHTPIQKTPIYLPDVDCLIKSQVPLATLTSFRVGGPAEWYVAPRRIEELQASLNWARSQELPITVLGAGSNMLISDRGLPGLVISTRHLRYIKSDRESGLITVGAGEPLPRLAWYAAEQGLQGLEWAVGIPGTVGGAVVMNAGAHNDCTANILVDTQILLPNGTLQMLQHSDLNYSYRSSSLQNSHCLVTQATFQLQPGFDPEAILAKTSNHLEHRRSTQPYHLPSCGSVFRNPAPYAAGWLVEQSGLKGFQIGGAQIATLHGNFILNCGGATATDIWQIIHHVQEQVERQWSIRLEPEVKILGEFPLL